MSSERAYLALGSNLGDRSGFLSLARNELSRLPSSRIVAFSSIEETAPLGGLDQPGYLNQMVLLETALEPRALLAACRSIERSAGRDRTERWGSRTLDIDIVRYGRIVMAGPELTIPHPGLGNREFWQREIAEIGRVMAQQEGRSPV
ncbi:MAG: 2-amino-4-hydroxy-6-hydroxymethyldihydropteridine diphosphokinase [Gemmatimonadota bacterium]